MAKVLALSAVVLTLAERGLAVSEWGQCGGLNYNGSTTCDAGLVCVYQNDWYSQCLRPATTSTTSTRSSSSSTSTRSSTSTSTSTRASSTTTTRATSTTTSSVPTSTGFVKTSGQKFTLNGSTFTVVGTNAYWIPQMLDSDIPSAFNDIKNAGLTVVRTWGFNEVTSDPGYGTWYQIWNGATPTVNTGSNGLAKFDYVVQQAKAAGLRLIVALTNNWSDYGGMDVYVKQILGSQNHDLFYTDATVKQAFKNYVNTFVTRYKNEPTIMAWELANEPRCRGSTGTTSGTCTSATVTAWARELSAYIKSIDSNHLVAIGDEGFFNQPSNPSYPYQGSEGIDFNTNLQISTVDFGTFHLYPESWGQSNNPSSQAWGTQWIQDHATSQATYNKPVIIEEFGVTSNQVTVYTAWWNTVVSSGLTGDLIWQAGSRMPSGAVSWDDGHAVYPDGAVYPVLSQHAAAIKARG